jgi:hypothetical protein
MSNQQILAHESGADRWYCGLIKLYPGAFRERYATEMLRIFEESWSRVSDRGAIARWRYWLHVLFDLIRTLPGEWLAAMPLPTKVSSLVIGIAVSLCVIDHQWLTIAIWLFSCAFMTVCWTLIRPSRLGLVPSLLLAGALGWSGFWITNLLAKFIILGSHYHRTNTADHLSVMVAMFVVLFCKEPFKARYPGWTSRSILSALCMIGIVLAQLKIISGGTNGAGTQIVMASFLFSTSVSIVTGQLAVIWRSQDHVRKPDFKTRPA